VLRTDQRRRLEATGKTSVSVTDDGNSSSRRNTKSSFIKSTKRYFTKSTKHQVDEKLLYKVDEKNCFTKSTKKTRFVDNFAFRIHSDTFQLTKHIGRILKKFFRLNPFRRETHFAITALQSSLHLASGLGQPVFRSVPPVCVKIRKKIESESFFPPPTTYLSKLGPDLFGLYTRPARSVFVQRRPNGPAVISSFSEPQSFTSPAIRRARSRLLTAFHTVRSTRTEPRPRCGSDFKCSFCWSPASWPRRNRR
jgi:hypothetical protein